MNLKWQLIISAIMMTPLLWVLAYTQSPALFRLLSFAELGPSTYMHAFWCTAGGLWTGIVIGYVSNYYTSNLHDPVQRIAKASSHGPATVIIHGLSLGMKSTIFPMICVAILIYYSYSLCYMYGVALAAIGMLSNLPLLISVSAFGPIVDNAGGIAEMCGLEEVRRITDALDAAGNTTSAIGKGYAIGAAMLVGVSLFGAFVTRSDIDDINILDPLQFAGLIIGAMLPYMFTSMTLTSVANASQQLMHEIKSQFRNLRILEGMAEPNYQRCVQICTRSSLFQMIGPGLLIILTPIILGSIFGPKGVSGLIAGVLLSGTIIALTFANAGGAWDNAKKYVESDKLLVA